MSLVSLAILPFALAAPLDISATLRAYQAIPANVMRSALKVQVDPATGWVGVNNKQGWTDVGHQRNAGQALSIAVAFKNEAKIEEMMRIVEQTFDRMESDGSWDMAPNENGKPFPPVARAYSNLAWLSLAIPGLSLLHVHHPSYRKRVDALRPKVRLATEYAYNLRKGLLQPYATSANLVVSRAAAFLSAGEFMGERKFTDAGNEFLQFFLTLQRPDGTFNEAKGSDTSYQGVSLQFLALIQVMTPSPATKEALQQGADWFLGRFLGDGKINAAGNSRTQADEINKLDGKPKVGHQPQEMSLALVYIAHALPDSRASATLDKFLAIAYDGDHPRPAKEFVVGGKGQVKS